MLRTIIAAVSGGLFGAGLLVSGMTDTTKVQGWLDVFGAWDPTLAFVLGGAILPMIVAWNMTTRRAHAIVGTPFPAKPDPKLSHNLVIGSVLFGAGWGLVGAVPRPGDRVAQLGRNRRDRLYPGDGCGYAGGQSDPRAD